MLSIDLNTLIKKLDKNTRQALENAIGMAVTRTHYDVECEHWLLSMLEDKNTKLAELLETQEVEAGILQQDLLETVEKFKTGNGRTPGLSPKLVELLRNGWLTASLNFKAGKVNSGHIMHAFLTHEDIFGQRQKTSSEFSKVNVDNLAKAINEIMQTVPETAARGEKPSAADTEALSRFTNDITEQARQGKIDPISGRDNEIRQIIDILTRRRQNNPILTGEAGVGKTAVVEGLALRVVADDVPPALQNVSIRYLDLAALQAGAGVKGEFESRLKSVIEEVQASPQPIILFVDEAHNLIGAGNQAGSGDAANLLKPALARGELRTIAATTWSEYKKYIESDTALTRRFQVVKIDEPKEDSAINMLRGLIDSLEKHHHVRILDEAVCAAVKLSHRYIPARQLPDKAISLLDTACARVRISQTATPPAVEDHQRQAEQLKLAIKFLIREQKSGANHKEKLAELNKELKETEAQLKTLQKNWKKEKELVQKIGELRKELEELPDPENADKLGNLQQRMRLVHQMLTDERGEIPLLYECVDAQIVASIVSDWTGIPLGKMQQDEINSTLTLEKQLNQRVLGQSQAMHAIAQQLQIARANLHDPGKPRGVFLLVGSSGVGKTETACVLADLLYGGEQHMTVINMSEFKESHKISMLTGSPAGYVGYGEGGILTEAVRRRPYSVVLLDEMEKAHPSVQEAFYQVFDKGIMMDGEGRKIDFKNTLIIMASNVGTETLMKLHDKHGNKLETMDIAKDLQPELLKHFKPAFLGRVTTISYVPLPDKILAGITVQKLDRIKHRVELNYNATCTYTKGVINEIVKRCQAVNTGARNIDSIINNTILPQLSQYFLEAMAKERSIKKVNIKTNKKGEFLYDVM